MASCHSASPAAVPESMGSARWIGCPAIIAGTRKARRKGRTEGTNPAGSGQLNVTWTEWRWPSASIHPDHRTWSPSVIGSSYPMRVTDTLLPFAAGLDVWRSYVTMALYLPCTLK